MVQAPGIEPGSFALVSQMVNLFHIGLFPPRGPRPVLALQSKHGGLGGNRTHVRKEIK